jgi:hypothetical protein
MAEPDLNCFALASCLSRLPQFCTKSEEEPKKGIEEFAALRPNPRDWTQEEVAHHDLLIKRSRGAPTSAPRLLNSKAPKRTGDTESMHQPALESSPERAYG